MNSEEQEKVMKYMDELAILTKPLMDYLSNEIHPYHNLVITKDSMTLNEVQIHYPIKTVSSK